MKFNADEIASVIQKEIETYESSLDVREVGTVLEVGDGIARVYGLSSVMAGEMVQFPNGVTGLAFNLEENSVGVIILGDYLDIEEGDEVRSLGKLLQEANKHPDSAWVALKQVPDPGRYGVAELRGTQVIGIEEKPAKPKSDMAVAGIYVYPADVFSIIKTLKPSGRGELEITDVNRAYLENGRLGYSTIDGYWTDAGTLDSLAVANELVREAPPR